MHESHIPPNKLNLCLKTYLFPSGERAELKFILRSNMFQSACCDNSSADLWPPTWSARRAREYHGEKSACSPYHVLYSSESDASEGSTPKSPPASRTLGPRPHFEVGDQIETMGPLEAANSTWKSLRTLRSCSAPTWKRPRCREVVPFILVIEPHRGKRPGIPRPRNLWTLHAGQGFFTRLSSVRALLPTIA